MEGATGQESSGNSLKVNDQIRPHSTGLAMSHSDQQLASNQAVEKACSLTRDGATISLDDLRMALENLQADADIARRATVAALKKHQRILVCCNELLNQLKDLSLQS